MNVPMNLERVELCDVLEDAEQLAGGVHIENRTHELKALLKFEPNLKEPIHRWFRFKEAFSSLLVTKLLREYCGCRRGSVAFLDPFCGVGTSLLAAEETFHLLGVKNILLRGIEVNPYIHFVAAAKLAWDRYSPAIIRRAAAASMNGLLLPQRPSRPTLSTMQNQAYIQTNDLDELLELRDKIRLVTKGRLEQRPLLVGFAAAAESAFNLRKDGRALRYQLRDGKASVQDEVERRWSEIVEDLQLGRHRLPLDYRVDRGDGRRADKLYRGQRFDVILFRHHTLITSIIQKSTRLSSGCSDSSARGSRW